MRAREARAAWIFLSPWLAGLLFVTALPLLASLYLAHTHYDILSAPRWVGWRNFQEMFFADRRFWAAVKVTVVYVVVSVPIVIVVSLALAMALNRGLRGLALYRTAFYIPSLIGGSVAVALLWRQVFGAEGVFNDFLALFGIEGRSWIGSPQTALGTLIALHGWAFGATMVIFLAALKQIPADLYEAARIDGASAWARFRYVTLPLLTPVTFFNIVLQTIQSFQAFTQAHVISQGRGGPVDSTLMYTLYLYQKGFQDLEMGYAAAMAWVLLATIAAVTALYFWSAKYWVFYGD